MGGVGTFGGFGMGPPLAVPDKEEKLPIRGVTALRPGSGLGGRTQSTPMQPPPATTKEKSKSGLGLGRFAGGVGGRKKK